MKKIEKDYIDEFGDISRDPDERFRQLVQSQKLSKKSREQLIPYMNKLLSTKWKTIDFTIYLVPKATPRPRHSIITNTFYVSGAKDNKEIFKKNLAHINCDMITTPCKFTTISYFPIPSSMSGVEKILAELGLIRPISKPDFDNVCKTYADMIQGTLLFDDALIIEGISKKFYSSKPRIEIHIEYMTTYDSKYNEKKIRKKVN